MKKILSLILIFAVVICTACNTADDENAPVETPNENKPEIVESETPDNTSPQQNFPEQSSDPIIETRTPNSRGEMETPTFVTYEGYLEFISGFKKLTDDFITYDMLKEIGDFEMFIAGSSLNSYEYTFRDENGKRIHIRVEPLPTKIKTYHIVNPQNINDLRNVTPTGDAAEYSHNNITYGYYFNGKLASIRWSMGTKLVILTRSGDSNTFSDYPLDGETTFVSQLLSTQTATAAVQSFNQKVEAEIAKNIANKQFES